MDVPSLTKLVEAIRATGFDQRLVLFGSASALASFPDLGTSEDSIVRRSRPADFVLELWDDEVALKIHDRVGARKSFDMEHWFYADVVRPMAFENFPPGWDNRLVALEGCYGVVCLEPHDMAVAKCFPARPKDRQLLVALITAGRLDPMIIMKRLSTMSLTEAWIVKSHRFLHEVAAEAGQPLPM